MQLLFSARETIATLVNYKCKTFITLTPGHSVLISQSSSWSLKRPYSYSHGCTGNEHEREANAGKHFKWKLFPLYEPPSHARSSPTVRIRIRSISQSSRHSANQSTNRLSLRNDCPIRSSVIQTDDLVCRKRNLHITSACVNALCKGFHGHPFCW